MLQPDPKRADGPKWADPGSVGRRVDRTFGSQDREDLQDDVVLDPVDPELMAREIFVVSGQQDSRIRHRDYWTATLLASVVALAVLLGWMLGRAGWNMAVNRAQRQILPAPEEVLAAAQATPDILPVSSTDEKSTTLTGPIRSSPASPALSNPAPKPKVEVLEPDGGLVMYEHGKVVFRMAPSEEASPSADEAGSIQTEATGQSNSGAAPALVPSQPRNSYLLSRIEPEYPEEARRQHTQGAVVMKALVGIDGSVQEVKVISGDPQLAKAATEAVRQWRFRPHDLKGKPAEFETRITVNFALP
jgi:TonB family protein